MISAIVHATAPETARRRLLWLLIAVAGLAAGQAAWQPFASYRDADRLLANAHIFLERAISSPLVCASVDTCRPAQPGEEGVVVEPESNPFVADAQLLVERAEERLKHRAAAVAPSGRTQAHARYLGTAWGIAIAVLLGTLTIGQDFNWGVWTTLAISQRRRAAIVLGRILVTSAALIVVWLFLVGVTSVVGALSARAFQPITPLGETSGTAGLMAGSAVCFVGYGVLGAAAAAIARSTMGGLFIVGTSLGLEHVLARWQDWTRYLLPSQAVGYLMDPPPEGPGGWLPVVRDRLVCSGSECVFVQIGEPPVWVAAAAIAVAASLAVVAASGANSLRDL